MRCAVSRRAFTLVELLVVIGIITVLIALLMPALSKIRRDALTLKCASHLRSIGQALTMYTQQSGYYPGGAVGGLTALWPARLKLFTGGNRDVFYCPAADERCRWRYDVVGPRAGAALSRFGYEEGEPVLDFNRGFFSYGYNIWGGGGVFGYRITDQKGLGDNIMPPNDPDPEVREAFRELRASRVRVPEDMIAIADSTADGNWDFAITAIRRRYAVGYIGVGAVHSGGTNVLYCDGHVQWHSVEELFAGDVSSNDPAERARRRKWRNDHWYLGT